MSSGLEVIYDKPYDVIVVGGGHAGCEAALAAARMGRSTLLLTMNVDKIGAMSCNPAIGGVGKGHLVREVDAMGGQMALAADATGIQFRRLNTKKGPAVRARRCQSDKARYATVMRSSVENTDNLTIKQGTADELIVENNRITGLRTTFGIIYKSKAVILTTGTFLNGLMHVGAKKAHGGRAGDRASTGLTAALESLGLQMGRLKTGTVPRLDRRTIDIESLPIQYGDTPPLGFSFWGPGPELPQQVCWVTETNEKTHEIIRKNLDRSPIYGGDIESSGPRYCPSIEDKVVRFSHKQSHRIFLEPEGLDTNEIYPNGISTSLPYDVQIELVRTIPGCENAEIVRPGYAVEYTFVDPTQLDHTLAVSQTEGLFLAGQINGTTGYEEAAAQGLIAGINAALFASPCKKEQETRFTPDRSEAYLGVLVDDLVTRGCTEPYRMFTSRAEHRLLLREDNADERLTEQGRALGLIDDTKYTRFQTRWRTIDMLTTRLSDLSVKPTESVNDLLKEMGTSPISETVPVANLLKRPDFDPHALKTFHPEVFKDLDWDEDDALEQVSVRARYSGYINRQNKQVQRHLKLESLLIPEELDYENITALSHEVRQVLAKVKPRTIGQAGRIEGVTPAAIGVLLVHLKRITKAA